MLLLINLRSWSNLLLLSTTEILMESEVLGMKEKLLNYQDFTITEFLMTLKNAIIQKEKILKQCDKSFLEDILSF